MPSKKDIVAAISERILQRPFSLSEFAQHLAQEGGYDMHDLPPEQLAALVEDRFEGDWDEPNFSFQEIIDYWDACIETDGKLDPEALVCWVGSMLIVGEMARRGHTGWGAPLRWLGQFNVLQNAFSADECAAILGETFRAI